MSEPQRKEEHTAQILPFKRKKKPVPVVVPRSALEGLGKYARGEPDDFTHRQKMNAAALLILILLIVGGVWLATKLADLRRDQDCVMAGRRNCGQAVPATPSPTTNPR